MAEKKRMIEVSVAEVVDHLRITDRFMPALKEVVERKITAEAAKNAGMNVSDEELQKASETFRIAKGLYKATDMTHWLESNKVSEESWERFIETSVLVNWFKDYLEKKADKNDYMSMPEIKEAVRELIYQDWVRAALE